MRDVENVDARETLKPGVISLKSTKKNKIILYLCNCHYFQNYTARSSQYGLRIINDTGCICFKEFIFQSIVLWRTSTNYLGNKSKLNK